MKRFMIKFMINGVRNEQIVCAYSIDDAKRIISSRYSTQRVNIISWDEMN